MVTASSGRFIASPQVRERAVPLCRPALGYVLGGVGVIAGAGVVGHAAYASLPKRTSTMPLVMRFHVASPRVRRVSPRYGALSVTS